MLIRSCGALARSAVLALAAFSPLLAAESGMPPEDPYLWLEAVTEPGALDWVRSRNTKTTDWLESRPGFAALQQSLQQVLDSPDKIPNVVSIGHWYYNFWTDAEHPRGLWRRTTPAEYANAQPNWEVLLDLDALNRSEGENWVWHGADCLREAPVAPGAAPRYRRCLIALSRGGADADVTREFDLETRSFVADGFFRPEAKGELSWISRDEVLVSTDFGPGSLTESGYAREVRRWRRGTPMASASPVYAGLASDLGVSAVHDDTEGFERSLITRTLAFYNDELHLLAADGATVKLDAPNSASKSLHREWLLLELREPWAVAGKTYPAGALLAARLEAYQAGQRDFTVLFSPDAHSSLAGYSWTRHHLLVNVMEDVKNRIEVFTPGAQSWRRMPLEGAPKLGTVTVRAVDDQNSDQYFLSVADFLTPSTLMLGNAAAGAPQALKSTAAFFDASGLHASQRFARSRDGTQVPYFIVGPRDMPLDGSHPTLLYGYGGFEISLTPSYSGAVGRAWLTQGGVYVVANIRGGGEYGPRWHQAALRENRLRAYEDFAAVAEDLIARKVTQPARLGIQGGSNGGLLMGNMTVLYPPLFGAVVCQVPLLDMKRYNKLLAGASWMAEYGNPDEPEDWAFIQHFSPYQNLRAEAHYPPVLFETSTRDDRVHPGHARKMMARMEQQGHEVWYYENIEGGHGGAADNAQRAHMQALAYTFLREKLFPKADPAP